MGNGINKILPGLYLGNLKDSQDKDLLAKFNITHILSIHDTAKPVLEDMKYRCISASDHSKQNLCRLSLRMPYFKDSIVFIHESRLQGGGCLVHCVAGVSRSVTLVVAYLMTVTGLGWVDCLAAIRAARPCARPNLGFLRQLEEYENLDLAQYRTWWTEQFGKNPFNDHEEIKALLDRKSQDNSDAMATSIVAPMATSRT
ncbi:dual specificity protein phosphatase 22-B-like isoform X1 [Gadus macrocephalus]|uniref:dual specificity protein phosphatase 22-B-like isoform X1 n=1 Tax=Gadus macrocephalus TaxID=80720 RepID=UPI0028CB43D3|nr:dual specificity protein phosphatase 22-B-like isoform X1 [Gadus macrocephalus]